jgi:hypothetical protein
VNSKPVVKEYMNAVLGKKESLGFRKKMSS